MPWDMTKTERRVKRAEPRTLRGFLVRILYSTVVHGRQRFYQAVADLVDFFQRQAAFVELPVEQAACG